MVATVMVRYFAAARAAAGVDAEPIEVIGTRSATHLRFRIAG